MFYFGCLQEDNILAKQVHLYSLDTSAFYMGDEVSIEHERRAAQIRANMLKSAIKIEREFLDECARIETQEELAELNEERLKDLKAIHFIEQETDEMR